MLIQPYIQEYHRIEKNKEKENTFFQKKRSIVPLVFRIHDSIKPPEIQRKKKQRGIEEEKGKTYLITAK